MELKDMRMITKILDHIEDLRATSVKVTVGEVTVEVSQPNKYEANQPSKFKAKTVETKQDNFGDPSKASTGQIKFARDLLDKVFGSDERAIEDFLAHVWGLPINEVPDIDTWEETLTKDMVGPILDKLELMYRQVKNDGKDV